MRRRRVITAHLFAFALLLAAQGFGQQTPGQGGGTAGTSGGTGTAPFGGTAATESAETVRQREALVDSLRLDKVFGSIVYENAFRTVPRHLFVSSSMQRLAYQDIPLPGPGPEQSTIPSLSTLALIIRYLRPMPQGTILVAGSSAGYAAALLSRLCAQVYLIEWYADIAAAERQAFNSLGYRNISVVAAKDFGRFTEAGPFDMILIHGSVTEIPRSLIEQLTPSGRLVASLRDRTGMQMVVYLERFQGSASIQSLGTSLISPLEF